MEKSEKGSNFYMLTAQILNDKNLSHSEKLTMAILNGLSREDGSCYPSNEWLQEKLDIKENAIRKILENLEKNNYIKRQIMTCASNPFKKYRIIYVNANFKLSLPALEKEQSEPLENDYSDPSKTDPIIYKKNIIEEEEREGASPQAAPTPPPTFFKIHKRVRIESKKYDTLVTEFGVDKIKEMMDRLDEYADLNPKRFKQYSCHAAVIRKWIREDLQKKGFPSKSIETDLDLIKRMKEHPGIGKRNDIVFGHDYVEFSHLRVKGEYFKAGDPKFRDGIINALKKMGIPLK